MKNGPGSSPRTANQSASANEEPFVTQQTLGLLPLDFLVVNWPVSAS